jgi:uncharacterized membrane-anchored protein
MLCSSQNGTTKQPRPVLAVLLGSVTLTLMCQLCRADLPAASTSQSTEWNSGPAMGALGSLAEIKVPQGYSFMDAPGARALFEGMKQPVPKNLLGLLAQDTDKWWIVLQFADIGYVKDPEKEQLNPADILNSLHAQLQAQNAERKKQGQAEYSGVEWELKPLYDAADHTLGWAVRKQSASQPVVSQTVRVFCRRGAVDATVVLPYRGFSDLVPVRRLVKDIALKPGERYEDFQAGDKACASGLAALVMSDDMAAKPLVAGTTEPGTAGPMQARTRWMLVGGGVLACAGVLGGALVFSRRGRRKAGAGARTSEAAAPETAAGSEVAPRAIAAARKPGLPAIGRPMFAAKPPVSKLRSTRSGTNGKHLNGKSHGPSRRKVFDYNRYFTDLMGAVSSHSSQMDMPTSNGVSFDSSRVAAEVQPQDGPAPAPAIQPNHHNDLMASQRSLIEEQKRLIQEQNKLIEEKTRLISEKNQLLKMQSQLMEDKLL